ncbi:hypothetical protein SAY87_028535 [Trapa incisa]|uniref:AIPP2-like SPOC-like domain-containing protein n=1 Tax=Trapa incisa TaxID=236973 RepID=A0AAN7KUW4_9MYRT|nr:hypothetical protein SAY87_028535 [Trapa incisa]
MYCAGSHFNGSPKQKSLLMDFTPSGSLHPQRNGKEDQATEVEKDRSNPLHEASACYNEDEIEEKYVDKPALLDHPPVKSVPCDDGEETDAMEQDVKVCDICGDTGREDLLAICCRCSDGAEHTYCMQEMLQKVPDGDWLCEECKISEETAVCKSALVYERKNSGKATQVLGKRPADENKVAFTKKQALDINVGTPRMSNLNGTAVSSGNSSLNMEKGKGRACHEFSESPCSPSASRIEASKNILLKSKSFSALNAKPKVKQVEDGFLQKLKGAHHHSLLDTKTSSLSALGKSTSFKCVNRGGQDFPDSKIKTSLAKFSSSQELNGGFKEKNENAFGRNKLHRVHQDNPSATRSSSIPYTRKLDHKLSSRFETLSHPSVNDNWDSNIIQSDSRSVSSLSKSSTYVACCGKDVPMGSESSSSEGGHNISFKKRSNQVRPNSGMVPGLSRSQKKLCNTGAGIIQDAFNRACQIRDHIEKSQESSAGRIGKAVTSGSRNAFCDNCEKSGHTAEFCSHGISQASEIDISAAKFVRGDMNSRSKSNSAVTSAMLKKPGIYRRNKGLDKSGSSSVPNATSTQVRATFQDNMKKSENTTKLNGVNEATYSLKAGILESKWNPMLREIPSFWKSSIIPEHDCIWRGRFQVQRGNNQIDLHGGFQAHLPSSVSPMVQEMVTKFTDKIALNEVPRMSSWPVQFRDNGTREHHIALYFFAQDLESYQRNYKGLLDNMMKGDLALKADFGIAELLVFPSNQLPEKSQRWNMSFYLWGIFKGSRANCLDHGESSTKKQKNETSETKECNGSKDVNFLTDGVSHQFQNLNNCSMVVDNLKQVHDLNDCSAVEKKLKQVHGLDECSPLAKNLKGENHGNGVTIKEKETVEGFLFHVGSKDLKELKTGDDLNDCSIVSENLKQVHDLNDCTAVEKNVKQVHDLNEGSALAKNLKAENHGNGVTVKGKETAERFLFHVGSQDSKELKTGDDLNDCSIVAKNLKQVHGLNDCAAAEKNLKQVHDLNDCAAVEKNLKQLHDLNECSALAKNPKGEIHVNGVTIKEKETAERFLFHVSSQDSKELKTGDSSIPWKSESSLKNEFTCAGMPVPDLELALGAETKSASKGISFWVDQSKPSSINMLAPSGNEEDDPSASLSLTLAFPFRDDGGSMKQFPKEKLLREGTL